MASRAQRTRWPSNFDRMLELLGVDIGAPEMSQVATDYVKALRVCESCARGRSGCKGLVTGAVASGAALKACPNADLIVGMVFQAMPKTGASRMH